MSYDIQSGGDLIVERELSIQDYISVKLQSNVAPYPSGLYVQQATTIGSGALSNVKVKRPDGTWATVFQVEGVHLYYDGAWHVL